jgi:hypothetical protein
MTDPMQFILVKESLIKNVYGPAEDGRFQTIGFPRPAAGAEEIVDNLRRLTVYYDQGSLPKGTGSRSGPVQHDISFGLGLMLAAPAAMDLNILSRQDVTPAEIAAAISNSQEASDRADDLMDEFINIIYQITMDARNLDLGLPEGDVANAWVDQIQKQQPIPNGEYVVITASMRLTCRVAEDITGDAGVSGSKEIDTVIDQPGDPNEKTGVTVST